MRRDMSIEHKLRYVWRLFQRSESSLKSAVEDVANLQRQQGKDMLEVSMLCERIDTKVLFHNFVINAYFQLSVI